MAKITSITGESLIGLNEVLVELLYLPTQFPYYTVLIVSEGQGCFHADFGKFSFKGPSILFSTPLQLLYLSDAHNLKVEILQFHSDFYCIEYHRKEVACNGLLFNNIYTNPVISLNGDQARSMGIIFDELHNEFRQFQPSEIVLRAYLQLFLAKSGSIKMRAIEQNLDKPYKDLVMERFIELLNEHYLDLRKPSDYAGLLAMTPNNFSKHCVRYFNKTPSHLISERLILEAKKQLHLTRQSIKEIAYNLNFEDESYFSRVFKKFTNVSPQAFRDQTGISIVADLHQD